MSLARECPAPVCGAVTQRPVVMFELNALTQASVVRRAVCRRNTTRGSKLSSPSSSKCRSPSSAQAMYDTRYQNTVRRTVRRRLTTRGTVQVWSFRSRQMNRWMRVEMCGMAKGVTAGQPRYFAAGVGKRRPLPARSRARPLRMSRPVSLHLIFLSNHGFTTSRFVRWVIGILPVMMPCVASHWWAECQNGNVS